MTRKFSSISVQTTLATGISNTALTVPVAVGTGSTLMGGVSLAGGNVDQYSILIDPNLASAEIMWVTGVSGDNLTVLRGKDGTSAVAHNAGAVIQHILTAGDLTYLTTGVTPTSDLANTGLPFPGSTSGSNTVKAPAIAGTGTVSTLPAQTGTLLSDTSIDAATSKTTPVDADEFPMADSAATFGLKKLTWANLKATLKTYFDGIYAAFKGPAVNTQTASYVLVASDVGKRVVMNAAGATTITVNTSLFGAGDTLEILNIGAGVCTITAGTATVSTAGTLALVQNAGGKLYFTSAGVSVFIPSAVATSSSGLNKISATSFSAVANTGTTFDGIFTSTYKKYLVYISNLTASITGSTISLQFRVGGVTSALTYYSTSTAMNYAGTVHNELVSNGTAIILCRVHDVDKTILPLHITQVGNISENPSLSGDGMSAYEHGPVTIGGNCDIAQIADGIILSASAGTITGTVTVYGLAN